MLYYFIIVFLICMKHFFMMKLLLSILLCFATFLSFAQNNHIVKTDDGRRVLLKADFTWEYIDLQEAPKEKNNTIITPQSVNKNTCNTKDGFIEPKLNSKIQATLKRGRATIKHVKQKVAKDYNCNVEDVILLSAKEQKEKAIYYFCVHGSKATYKRIGNAIIKAFKI